MVQIVSGDGDSDGDLITWLEGPAPPSNLLKQEQLQLANFRDMSMNILMSMYMYSKKYKYNTIYTNIHKYSLHSLAGFSWSLRITILLSHRNRQAAQGALPSLKTLRPR